MPTLQIFGPQTLAQLLRACRMQQQHQGEGRGSAQDGTSRPGSQVVSFSSPPPASYRNILRSFSFTLISTCLLLKPSQIILLDFLLPPNCEASYCEKQVSLSLKQCLYDRLLWAGSISPLANLFLKRCWPCLKNNWMARWLRRKGIMETWRSRQGASTFPNVFLSLLLTQRGMILPHSWMISHIKEWFCHSL